MHSCTQQPTGHDTWRLLMALILIGQNAHRAAAAAAAAFVPVERNSIRIRRCCTLASKLHSDNLSADEWKLDFQSLDQKGNWMQVDWNPIFTQQTQTHFLEHSTSHNNDHMFHRPTLSPDQPSPVEVVVVRDRIVYIKRDDLLRLRSSHVSGNKARKLLGLNEMSLQEFPRAVVSYGGPQSNAMVAIAAIVNSKNREYQEQQARGTTTIIDSTQQHVGVGEESDFVIQDNLSELDSESIMMDEDIQQMDKALFNDDLVYNSYEYNSFFPLKTLPGFLKRRIHTSRKNLSFLDKGVKIKDFDLFTIPRNFQDTYGNNPMVIYYVLSV